MGFFDHDDTQEVSQVVDGVGASELTIISQLAYGI